MICGDYYTGRAMRVPRRSGLLRTQPLRVFALREPPAIAGWLVCFAVSGFLGFALAGQL